MPKKSGNMQRESTHRTWPCERRAALARPRHVGSSTTLLSGASDLGAIRLPGNTPPSAANKMMKHYRLAMHLLFEAGLDDDGVA